MFSINNQPYDLRHFARFAEAQPEVYSKGPGEILADDDPDDTGIPLISNEQGWQAIWRRYLLQNPEMADRPNRTRNEQVACEAINTMINEHTRYLLLDKTGEPAENYHQDDSCDPVVADTLVDLISQAAEWAQLATGNFLKALDDQESEYAGYSIVREQVQVHELTDKDKAELQRIRENSD